MSTSALVVSDAENITHPYAEYSLADAVQIAKNYQSLHQGPAPSNLQEAREIIRDMASKVEHVWLTGMAALDLLDAAIDGKDLSAGSRYATRSTPASSHLPCSSMPKQGSEASSVSDIQDFVCSHGFGEATQEGVMLAQELMATGDDIATAAAEVVARGLTVSSE